MPIHEFSCQSCGRTFERLIRSDRERRSVRCDACGSDKVTRELSTFAVQNKSGPSGGGTCCGLPERCDSPPCSTGTCPRAG